MTAKGQHGRVYRTVRGWFVKAPQAKPTDLAGKTMLVTGSTEGSLGHETAVALARGGAKVVITTRSNVEAAADAIRGRVDGAQVEGHPLDLQSKRSIAAFVSRVATTTGGSIDVLVNNAGVHLDLLSRWKEPSLSDDGFETQWRINYLGTAHLTHLLLPFLRNAATRTHDARIVNVVSRLHVRGANDDLFDRVRPYSSWDAYGNSKLALVHFTLELQRRFSSEGLQAYCLHPGSVFTNVAARGLENTGFIETLRNAMAPVEAFFLRTPAEGAQTQVHCATAAGVPGGLYYEDCKPATACDQADDSDVALRLWRETSAWVAGETSDASLNA